MAYTRYLIPFSTTGGLSVSNAVKRFVQDLVATVPNLSIYDEPDNNTTILRLTNTDYCYMKVAAISSSYMRLYWGIGPTVANGSDDGNTQVTATVKYTEVVVSDHLMFFCKARSTSFYFGRLTSALDSSEIDVYGWGSVIRNAVSDSTYADLSFSVPTLGSAQLAALEYGEYYLGEGTCYGNIQTNAKAPWLHLGHGPYYLGGNPSPSTGVYRDSAGNAFYYMGSNNVAWRIAAES